MSRRRINGFDLYYERHGHGEPVVLVHGSWTDHGSWTFVVDDLAQTNHVVTYDRRGHSRSERGAAAVPRRVDEDDLVALIESLATPTAPRSPSGWLPGGPISCAP